MKVNRKIRSYDFPEADTLGEEIRLVRLDENINYSTQHVHRHNYFELFYFIKGGGSHFIDFSDYPILNNSLHIVNPGALHLVKRTPQSKGYVLLFTKNFLYSLVDFTPATHRLLWSRHPIYPLTLSEDFFVSNSLMQIRDELKKDRDERMKVMASLLHMIFILMYRRAPQTNNTDNSLTEAFFTLLENKMLEAWSASDYAMELNCSLKALNLALHRANYPTVTKNIQERKTLEARRLLIHTNWSVKEISYYLSFDNPDYFGKVFKSFSKISPLKFRKTNS